MIPYRGGGGGGGGGAGEYTYEPRKPRHLLHSSHRLATNLIAFQMHDRFLFTSQLACSVTVLFCASSSSSDGELQTTAVNKFHPSGVLLKGPLVSRH